MTPAAFRKLALSLPGAREEPHFDRASFRAGKRIFATMTRDGRAAMIPVKPIGRCLSLLQSDPHTFIDHGGFTRKMGALGFHLAQVDPKLVKELMHAAWERAAAPQPRASARKKAPSTPAGKTARARRG